MTRVLPIELSNDSLMLFIRLTPSSSRDQINGFVEDDKNDVWLKSSVTAIPEKGKANKALIKMLSKKLKISKSSFNLISGETDRNKVFLIISDDLDATFNKLKDFLRGF